MVAGDGVQVKFITRCGRRGEVDWSSFGNFVFLGLRSNSGIGHHGDVDSFLHGEDGLQY
jgi:hypothetical protein